jgi:hypothetical protein
MVTVPLSQFFGCNNMNITVEKKDEELYITFIYKNKNSPFHFNLPIEINKHIYSDK